MTTLQHTSTLGPIEAAQEEHQQAVRAEESRTKRMGEISEILLQFRSQPAPNLIKALVANLRNREKTNIDVDPNTRDLINRVRKYSDVVERGQINFNVTLDPQDASQQLEHDSKGKPFVTRIAGKNHDTEPAFRGEDQMREQIIELATQDAQAQVNAIMNVLDDLRIPYSIPIYDGASNTAGVTIVVNEHDFEQAMKPLRDLPKDAQQGQKEAAAAAFWTQRNEERPEQVHGQNRGGGASEENRRRASIPKNLVAIG